MTNTNTITNKSTIAEGVIAQNSETDKASNKKEDLKMVLSIEQIRNKVIEELWKRDPKELVNILLNSMISFIGPMGNYTKQHHYDNGDFRKGVVEFCNKNSFMNNFIPYYLEWYNYAQNQIMEEDGHGVSLNSVDSDKSIYNGFENYIYYLTWEVIESMFLEKILDYLEILVGKGIEANWDDTNNHDSFNPFFVIFSDSLVWNHIFESIKMSIKIDLESEFFKIEFSNYGNKKEYSFDNFDNFLSKLIEIKSELDENYFGKKMVGKCTSDETQLLINYLIEKVEDKGYTVQREGTDCPFKEMGDDLISYETELFIYDKENESDQTEVYYWEICDSEKGEVIGVDKFERFGDDDYILTSEKEVDYFLKDKLSNFKAN